MTSYNQATLKTFFETGDVPFGSDYANLIDSFVNTVDTSNQMMAGSLTPTELITARVSATNANVTGTLSAGTFAINNLSITTDISAGGTVYASASRAPINYHGTPVIISAAGTAQATGALLTSEFCRLQGASDGQTTGFTLKANQIGWVQYLSGECSVSANLWPPTGGTINALSTNIPFPIAANTSYIVMHRTASSYAVK